MRPIPALLIAAACALCAGWCRAADVDPTLGIRKGTVRIQTTYIQPDYYTPWRMKNHGALTGSGAIIRGNVILTNAHVVSDATFIQVQKENDPNRYEAEAVFIGHECDLAILKPKDARFFADTAPLDIGEKIPNLKSVVATYGFPIGGERISITEGVVSRIEMRAYTHSNQSMFLVVQTDAAINPGNSGGPVIQDGKLVGVAFQAQTGAENIGYMIPTPIVHHFLKDVSDGRFDGFPDLGVTTDDLESESYRAYLGMAAGQSGVIVTRVTAGSSAVGQLQEGDVITRIDGVSVANDGSIPFEEGRTKFTHLVDMKSVGDSVELGVWRDRKPLTVTFRVGLPPVRIAWFDEFETLPRYYIYAGILFEPLSREYLETWNDWYSNADPRMLYYYTYAERDRCEPERKEFVVLNRVLPDRANTYISDVTNKVVDRINGMEITRLEDVIEAFQKPSGKYHVIEVEGGYKPLIMDAQQAREASERILQNFRIPWDRRLNKCSGYGRP